MKILKVGNLTIENHVIDATVNPVTSLFPVVTPDTRGDLVGFSMGWGGAGTTFGPTNIFLRIDGARITSLPVNLIGKDMRVAIRNFDTVNIIQYSIVVTLFIRT